MSNRSLISSVFILSLAIAFFGCDDKVKRPDNIIEKDEFAAILADIHLVEATYLQGREIPDSLQEQYFQDYNLVFKIHDVDKVTFFNNFRYYSAQPALLAEIYEVVHTRLQVQQDQLLHQHEPTPIDTSAHEE